MNHSNPDPVRYQRADATRSHLRELAGQVVSAFPDLHASARAAAVQLLRTQGVRSGNPDLIYWHRFSGAASSSRSYTGWEHYGAPEQSMTLTELVMRRFRVSDQDNADLLASYGGFYTAGPEARKFDESNEVRLEPQRVLNALWAMDFAAGFQRQRGQFWQQHADNVRTLAKLNYLSEALQAGISGQLDEPQVQLVFAAVGFDCDKTPAPGDIEHLHTPASGIEIGTLSLGGVVATDLLWLTGRDGLQVLYLPGAVPSFQGFSSEREVAQWLFGWLQTNASSEQLLAYFTHEPQQLAALRSRLQGWARSPVESFARQVRRSPISAEAFTWMRDNARRRMVLETDAALRTNAELRAQLWIGYLGVASRLLGYVAPAGWPLALLAVAVGSASLGLNIEQAIDGDNGEERHAGLLGAIVAGVELVIGLPFLIPLGRSAEQQLGELEGNLVIGPAPASSGASRGVSTLADGAQYVELEGLPYRVRYDAALNTWLIVPQDNPFAFTGVVPIRLDEQGRWLLVEPATLRGGGQYLGGQARVQPVERLNYSAFDVSADSYEVPESARPAMREVLSTSNRRAIGGDYYDPESPLTPVQDSLERIRLRLRDDANAYFARSPRLAVRSVTVPEPGVTAQRAFMQLFDEHPGVVIGESHASIASKRWLMENLKPLFGKGVRTLYLEHVMTDMHQADLELFSRFGRMSHELQRYLESLDAGHKTDAGGVFNFLELVRKARANRISVQAIDCAASYRLEGMAFEQPGNPLRQKIMNFYANRVISARQAAHPADKWIALVGNTHSNYYKRVPGVAELQGVPGMRIVDAGPGQATGITRDLGEYYLPSMGNPDGIVQADLRLALQTRGTPAQFLDPATAPPGVFRPRP